jgi:DNA-binding MarR family transcriptional regulator
MEAGFPGDDLLAPATLAVPARGRFGGALRIGGIFGLGQRFEHGFTVRRKQITCNSFLESCYYRAVATWSFFTNHGRVLICISRDPELRLRDLAATLGITERSAYGIVDDLVEAGYVVKEKDGRRNRYRVQAQLPLPERVAEERTIGEVLGVLVEADARRGPKRPSASPVDGGASGGT